MLEKLIDENVLRVLLYLLILSALLWIYRKADRNRILRKGIPGTAIPFFSVFGHVDCCRTAYTSRKHLPYYNYNACLFQTLSAFRTLHQGNALFVLWVSYIPHFFLCKANIIEEFFKSNAVPRKGRTYDFVRPWLGTGLLTSSGLKWKKRRKLLTPAFHFDILKEFLPVINEQAQVLVDILENSLEKEWIDVMEVMTLCSLDIICETTLGVRINAQGNENSEYVKAVHRAAETMHKRSSDALQFFDFIFYNTASGRQFRKDIIQLHGFTKEVIKKKKLELQKQGMEMNDGVYRKRKALMDLLIDHHMSHDDFTEEDVQEEVDTFAFAGHDTTSMGLSWTLYLIGLYPEVQKAIHEELDKVLSSCSDNLTHSDLNELKYLECTIKESLRLYPPVPGVARQAEEDVTLCGYHIPKGAEVLAHIWELHRDPEVFPNPEVFDPQRFFPENSRDRHPFAYTPFAAGPRNCIGQRFAMMELKTVLATVLMHFSIQSLDPRDQIIAYPALVLRSCNPLRLKITKRKAV